MSLTRLKYLMNEGTDDEIAQYLRGLGLANGAPLIGEVIYWPARGKPHELFSTLKGMVFFECNGQAFDSNTYPELAKVLSSKVIPDLRGEFLRCWDNGRGVDSGRTLMSAQGDAIRNITGTVGWGGDGLFSTVSGVFSGRDRVKNNSAGTISPADVSLKYANAYFDASTQVPTAPENRPRNVALQALIRAK